MLYVYIGCLTFGIIYSIVSAVFGGHGFHHGGIDHSGTDSADVPSPFNPLVLASAISTFGAVGIIGKAGFKMGGLLSAIFALTFAGIVGTIIFFAVVKLMYGSQSNSTFSLEDLLGTEAEVLVSIPVNGVGEITYSMNGVRCNLPAKSENEVGLSRGETVKISRITGNIAYVTRKITIDDIDLFEFEKSKKNENNKNI